MIQVIINALAVLTVISNIIIVALLAMIILSKTGNKKPYKQVQKLLQENAYLCVFIITLVSMLGSLFFSEVAKYTPCLLCWYQRILMYPQPIMLYIALLRGEKVLTSYLIALNSIGLVIASYHYFIQRFPAASILNCSANAAENCTKVSHYYFGYISIPFMAGSAFLLSLMILLLAKGSFVHKKSK